MQAEASPQRCQAPHQHHRGKEGTWARGAGCGPLPGSGSEPWAGRARAGRREVAVGGVRHCFIDVQKLPNKEAQVGPELPAWLGGTEGWGSSRLPQKSCALAAHQHQELSRLRMPERNGCAVAGRAPRQHPAGLYQPHAGGAGGGIRLCPPQGLPKAPRGAGEGRGAAVGAPHTGAAARSPARGQGSAGRCWALGCPRQRCWLPLGSWACYQLQARPLSMRGRCFPRHCTLTGLTAA